MQREHQAGAVLISDDFIAPPGATSIAAGTGSPQVDPQWRRLHRPSGGDLHCSSTNPPPPSGVAILHRPSGGDLHCSLNRMQVGRSRPSLHRPSGGDLHCSTVECPEAFICFELHRPSGGDLHCSENTASPLDPNCPSSSPLRGRPPLQRVAGRVDPIGPVGFIAPPGATSIAAWRSSWWWLMWSWLHRPSGGGLHCGLLCWFVRRQTVC